MTKHPNPPIPIPFGAILELGAVASEVRGVKRALDRSRGDFTNHLGTTTFGAAAAAALRRFQTGKRLTADGVYGPLTHQALTPFYDNYAFLLYTGSQPWPTPGLIVLPQTFKPTHNTKGLPGYPAIDVFGPPGTEYGAPADGIIDRLSGKDPAEGGKPGGSYGWSVYLTSSLGRYYLTHFYSRTVKVGAHVRRGEVLGVVCDARVAHMPVTETHIHEGFHRAV